MQWVAKGRLRKKIADNKADYILALKRNQQELFDDAVALFDKLPPNDMHYKQDVGHGRQDSAFVI